MIRLFDDYFPKGICGARSSEKGNDQSTLVLVKELTV